MQKLVTVYLDDFDYSYTDHQHREREHLQQYLADGWRITSVYGFGGTNEGLTVRGWIIALLEK
jgi:hypothetical protein